VVARTGSTRIPLTRERILAAALRIIDERGLDDLTMRALGAELGVEAMSIYRHVPGKGAVLDGVVELLLAELEADRPSQEEWQIHLADLARRFRAVSLAHPSAFPLLGRRSLSAYVAGQTMTASALATMIAGGFTPDDAIAALRAVVRFTLGFALSDPREGVAASPDGAVAPEAGGHPLVGALMEAVTDPEGEERLFEFGLAAMICGIEPFARS
jgi:TetR/AcrR family transcriptional regulator, tetracycline repressor protein